MRILTMSILNKLIDQNARTIILINSAIKFLEINVLFIEMVRAFLDYNYEMFVYLSYNGLDIVIFITNQKYRMKFISISFSFETFF